jgi:hypothetical protein
MHQERTGGLAPWRPWRLLYRASFLYKAWIEGLRSFTKGKKVIYQSDGIHHKELDRWITGYLKHLISSPERYAQSRGDLEILSSGHFRFCISMDLVEALNRNNLLMIFLVNFFFNPLLVLRIFLPGLILFQSNSMKIGLSSSQFLLGLCFKNIQRFHPPGVDTEIFIDDLRIATKKHWQARYMIILYKLFFGVMGFRWHRGDKYKFVDLETKPKVALERLGLIMGYRKNGMVYSRVRDKTLRKYKKMLMEVKRNAYCQDWKQKRIEYILFKGRFSFERAFPKYLRPGDAQPKQFYGWIRKKIY